MKTSHTIFFIIILLALVLFIPASYAQSSSMVFLTDVDSEQFPTVNLEFRLLDNNNKSISDISADRLSLYEDEKLVEGLQIINKTIGPSYVVFVVDLGQYAYERRFTVDDVRETLQQFVSGGAFRDGIDTVAIVTCQAQINEPAFLLLPPTKSQIDFLAAVNHQSLGTTEGNTKTLNCVRSAVEETMAGLVQPGFASASVILISPLIHAPSNSSIGSDAEAATVAAIARENRISIYSFHTYANSGSDQYNDPFRILAEGTGGDYLLFSPTINTTSLNRIYGGILAQGTVYHATFRSQATTSGEHRIVLLPLEVPFSQALSSSSQSYSVSLEEPEVVITSPSNNFSIERSVQNTNSGISLEPDTVSLTTEIKSWPYDLQASDIASVAVLIEGRASLSLPNPGLGPYKFDLDISSIQNQNERLVIRVEVKDKSGIVGTSDSIQLNINVNTFIPTQTPLPTLTPGPTPTPRVIIGTNICLEQPNSPECRSATIPVVLIALLSLALAVTVALLFMYRRQVGQVLRSPGDTVRRAVAEVRKTILGGRGGRGKRILAHLEVINARNDLIGNSVKIYTYTTTIGRNPKLCDVQLYDEDDNSSVSGLHCTIQYDRGTFFLTDDNSANGTEINNLPIEPNVPTELKNNDEVVLGDMFRRGAKLRFIIGEDELAPTNDTTLLERDIRLDDEGKTILEKMDEEITGSNLSHPDTAKKNQKQDKEWLNELE